MNTKYYCIACGKVNEMEDLSHRETVIARTLSLHCGECGKSKFEIIKEA